LMDSLLDTSKVEQHYALGNPILIVIVVHVKMDLVELLM